jgi:SAM-dependent methyltransferase
VTHYYEPSAESNRARLTPRPGDSFYLHMKDLRRALGLVLANARGTWLDFGCGGSPYRPLLRDVERYIRADVVGEGLDVVVRPGEELEIPAGTLNGILSTQVLEHVDDVPWYLCECARLLAPGGHLVLTTHGIWADHFWPHDFRRWTAEGLKREVESRGFQARRVLGLTCGMRAVVTLWELGGRVIPGRGVAAAIRVCWLACWAFYKVGRPILNVLIDAALRADAIRDYSSDSEGSLYIDVLVDAVRV